MFATEREYMVRIEYREAASSDVAAEIIYLPSAMFQDEIFKMKDEFAE